MKACPGCDLEFESLLYGLCVPCYQEKKSKIERFVRMRAKPKVVKKRARRTRSPEAN